MTAVEIVRDTACEYRGTAWNEIEQSVREMEEGYFDTSGALWALATEHHDRATELDAAADLLTRAEYVGQRQIELAAENEKLRSLLKRAEPSVCALEHEYRLRCEYDWATHEKALLNEIEAVLAP